jgi:pyrroline-5-carboxylate reductase
MTQSLIGFIGGGNMARSLIGGLVAKGYPPAWIQVSEPQAALRDQLRQDFGVAVDADNAALAARADVLVLAVKPQVMAQVCGTVRAALAGRAPLVLSIAAGIRMAQIEHWLGATLPVVRAMPNTPALIGAGAAGLVANAQVGDAQRAQAESILRAVGDAVWIEHEAQMDAVTAVAGSGPAYFFLLMEALESAAMAQGLSAHAARALVLQTALGAARMAREGDEPPATLRARVTSPGGTTQAALEVFEARGLRAIAHDAVARATERGRELAAQFD